MSSLAEQTLHLLYPDAPSDGVKALFTLFQGLFKGEHAAYQASDTPYHDAAHSLRVTNCFLRLLRSHQQHQAAPRLHPRFFHLGLAAILLHDAGFLKSRPDPVGSGGKHTFNHERRSCELAQRVLPEVDFSPLDVQAVQRIIVCTDLRTHIEAVPFANPSERVLGQMACTADLLGQMSDPRYLDKLPGLYREFEEADLARQLEPEARRYRSAQQLIEETPDFWHSCVKPKLDADCDGLYKHLSRPYPYGRNRTLEVIETHLQRIGKRRLQDRRLSL